MAVNWKKDGLIIVGVVAASYALYYAWNEYMTMQQTNATNAANAAATQAATAQSNASELQQQVAAIGSVQGTYAGNSFGSYISSTSAGDVDQTPISQGAQISAISSDALMQQIANLSSIQPTVPLAPVAFNPGSQQTQLAKVTASPAPSANQSVAATATTPLGSGGKTVGNPETTSYYTAQQSQPAAVAVPVKAPVMQGPTALVNAPTNALVQHTSQVH